MHHLSRLLFTAFLFVSLSACHGYRAADETRDSAAAIAIASRFLTDLDSGKIDDLMAISEFPFWGDGESLSDAEAFEAAAREEAGRPGYRFQGVSAGYVVPFYALEAMNIDLYQAMSKQMDVKGLYGVFLSVNMLRTTEDQTYQNAETLLIFVRKNAQEQWHVVGIDD
jgi:hypothetical protein